MTYGYKEATAVIGPLAPVAQPGALDLCREHAETITVPVGWQMVRLTTEFEDPPPSSNDLMALADAIRAASRRATEPPKPARREVRRPATDLQSKPAPRPKFTVIPGGTGQDSQHAERATGTAEDGSAGMP